MLGVSRLYDRRELRLSTSSGEDVVPYVVVELLSPSTEARNSATPSANQTNRQQMDGL